MKRTPNLRQIEAFKAVIECGSVSRAAEILHISQPAVSKLLAHLEDDTELKLFERIRGRLIPSTDGMRLYEEVDRVFAGIKQIVRAVDLIKRDQLGRLSVGVMPALSGLFISNVNRRFIGQYSDAYVSVIIRSSQFIMDWLLSKQVDVAIINRNTDNSNVECVPLQGGNFVCVLPKGHPLAEKSEITPQDIDGVPFIALDNDNRVRQKVESAVEGYGIHLNYIMEATLAGSICEMVADGLGISILDPLFAYGQRERLVIRPFRPEIESDMSLCWLKNMENRHLVEAYVAATRATVEEMIETLKAGG